MSDLQSLTDEVFAENPAPSATVVQYIQSLAAKARTASKAEAAQIVGDIQHILLQQPYVEWEDDIELAYIESIAGDLCNNPDDEGL